MTAQLRFKTRSPGTALLIQRRRFLQTVIEALRRIGPPAHAAIPALTVKTNDSNRLVRESALSALREIGTSLGDNALILEG